MSSLEPKVGDVPRCPDCGSRGFTHQWYAQGVLSVRGYLCSNLTCHRARRPWYTMGLQGTPEKSRCPHCGKPYMTVFRASDAPEIYLHKVQWSGLSNGLLVVTEACSLESRAFPVGIGG